MERSPDRWSKMVPEVVAGGSNAQIVYALRDAQADIASLAAALTSVLPILEATRLSVGLGKNQLERIERAKAVLIEKRA